MNVLITGALGWLGKALTETVGKHHVVRAFDLETPSPGREAVDFDGEVVTGDIADFASVRAAVEEQDAIIHAAVADTVPGPYQPGQPLPFQVNVQGTYNVLEAARQEGVGRIILIAAAETHVDHPPGTFVDRDTPYVGKGDIYDLTKRLQEEICRWFVESHGLNIVALRLGDIVDVNLGQAKRGEEQWKTSIDTDSWIDRYDAGNACLRALELDHEGWDVYHLVGAPNARLLFDVARAEDALIKKFTTDFDRRHASQR